MAKYYPKLLCFFVTIRILSLFLSERQGQREVDSAVLFILRHLWKGSFIILQTISVETWPYLQVKSPVLLLALLLC